MNKLLRFLMPKTARRLDEQQRAITKLEQEIDYFKTRLGSKDDVRERNYIKNGLAPTTATRDNPTAIRPATTVTTSIPTTYIFPSDYCSYSSSSSSDSGSCCCD